MAEKISVLLSEEDFKYVTKQTLRLGTYYLKRYLCIAK